MDAVFGILFCFSVEFNGFHWYFNGHLYKIYEEIFVYSRRLCEIVWMTGRAPCAAKCSMSGVSSLQCKTNPLDSVLFLWTSMETTTELFTSCTTIIWILLHCALLLYVDSFSKHNLSLRYFQLLLLIIIIDLSVESCAGKRKWNHATECSKNITMTKTRTENCD